MFVFRASLSKSSQRAQRGVRPVIIVAVEEVIGEREHDDGTREIHSKGIGTLIFDTLSAWQRFSTYFEGAGARIEVV